MRASPWLAALFFLGFLGLGYLYLERDAEGARLAVDWDVFRQSADKRLAALHRQLDDAKAAQEEGEKKLAEAAKAPAAPAKPAASGRTVIHISDMERDHPELAAILAHDARRNVIRNYANVFPLLNLSPDSLAKLKDLLVQQDQGNQAAVQAAEAQGLERGTPEWRAAIQQSAQGLQQQITDVLQSNGGSMNFLQLQAMMSMANTVQYNYGPDEAVAGAPLADNQAEALIQAMSSANYAGKDLSQRPEGYNNRASPDDLTPHESLILNTASSSLSQAQLQVIKTDMLQSAQQSAIMRQYMGNGPVRIENP
jgi:hypothetical protein